jgi:hypothetical protein
VNGKGQMDHIVGAPLQLRAEQEVGTKPGEQDRQQMGLDVAESLPVPRACEDPPDPGDRDAEEHGREVAKTASWAGSADADGT